jgi:hypothetical protein
LSSFWTFFNPVAAATRSMAPICCFRCRAVRHTIQATRPTMQFG